MNDTVLEVGKERWIQERSGYLSFYQAINLCLAIDFSRPTDGYDCNRSHLYFYGGLPKGVTMKGV